MLLISTILEVGLLLLLSSSIYAMSPVDDTELSDVSATGLAFAWPEFRIQSAPTSYIEQTGATPPPGFGCTATGNVAGNQNCWRRGDLRWYGPNASATGTVVGQASDTVGVWNTSWPNSGSTLTQCTNAGYNGLGCPRGGAIVNFAAHDNPYALRVWSYGGDGTAASAIGNGIVTYQGNNATGTWPGGGSSQTVLEWLAPTAQPNYRVSWWGELEVGRGGTGTGLLKSQAIVQGNAAGSALRFFKFTQDTLSPGLNTNDLLGSPCTLADCTTDVAGVDGAGTTYNNRTLAMAYESRLRGDFRFSIAQAGTPNDTSGTPVVFHSFEGLHFRNVDAYFPLGQLFYQALTINLPRQTDGTSATNGNFALEIPVIPNRTAVFTRFYSLLTSGVAASAVPHTWDYGYATARSYLLGITSGANTTGYPAVAPNYGKTHGYSIWGNWFPCGGVGCPAPSVAIPANRNSYNDTSDGIFFGNITAYNAFAYRPQTIDVRPGDRINATSDQAATLGQPTTTISNYANFSACTAATSGGNIWLCGYGGSYAAGGAVTSATIMHPAHYFLYDINGSEAPTTASRPVLAIPADSAINLGDSRILGMQINFLRATSLSAQY